MSDVGQFAPKTDVRVTSAFHPTAIKSRTSRHFGFGPHRDSCSATNVGRFSGRFCHRVTTRRTRLVAGTFFGLGKGHTRTRQNDPKFGELAGHGIDVNSPAMLLDDDVVTNRKA